MWIRSDHNFLKWKKEPLEKKRKYQATDSHLFSSLLLISKKSESLLRQLTRPRLMRSRRTSGRGTLQTITTCKRFLSSSLLFSHPLLSAHAAASKGFYLYLAHLALFVQLLQARTGWFLLVSFSSLVLLISYHMQHEREMNILFLLGFFLTLWQIDD